MGTFGVVWGLVGIMVLLSFAIIRLAGIAIDAMAYPFTDLQWMVLIANTVFMAHAEGYRGFQKSFSPREIGRAHV